MSISFVFILFIIIIAVSLFLKLIKGKQKKLEKCSKCERKLGELDTNFCRYCGAKLKSAPKKRPILKTLIIVAVVILILLFIIGSLTTYTSIKRAQPPMRTQPFEPSREYIETIREMPEPYPPEEYEFIYPQEEIPIKR